MQTLMNKVLPLPKVISRRLPETTYHVAGVPHELPIEIDHNGSPVSKRPSEWFVCFVPGLQKQWWHRFANPRHQHVFALKMVEDNHWVVFEPWWTRIMVTVLDIDEAVKFLRWGALGTILKVTERIPGNGNQARGWANCAVLTSLMLGRSYWTWTPHGLYRRLAAENGVKQIELTDFLEEKLASMTWRMAGEVLGDVSALTKLSPEGAFTEIGKCISRIMFSSSSLCLYRLVLSEAPRFPDAVGTFFTHGPCQAIASVKALISRFCESGQFRECNHERASRAFLSMLLGNLYLEVVLGCRTEPNERDLESHTKSVVQAFLRGLGTLSVRALRNRQDQAFASVNEKNRIGLLAHVERTEMPAKIAS